MKGQCEEETAVEMKHACIAPGSIAPSYTLTVQAQRKSGRGLTEAGRDFLEWRKNP